MIIYVCFLSNCRERKEMSTGKAPKKNNYAQKNEMDLNFPIQFGKKDMKFFLVNSSLSIFPFYR